MPDILSVVLRALSFVLQLQAAGTVFFVAAFGPALTVSLPGVRTLARMTALAALAAAAGHYILEAARMAGDMSGILDSSLQNLAWTSSFGGAFTVRVLGLLLIIAGMRTVSAKATASRFFASSVGGSPVAYVMQRLSARGFTIAAVTGAVLVAVSFTLVGHTATSSHRGILAQLLLAHLLIVAFWFGALWPLCLITLRESRERVARVVGLFSWAALWLVPLILVAGVAMAVMLLPDFAALRRPYGELLIAKAALFAVLLGCAALNKWRLGPGLGSGDPQAGRSFRRVVIAEYAIMVVVLAITAVMTTFFSPE
jgi:putative copper resistance protein D